MLDKNAIIIFRLYKIREELLLNSFYGRIGLIKIVIANNSRSKESSIYCWIYSNLRWVEWVWPNRNLLDTVHVFIGRTDKGRESEAKRDIEIIEIETQRKE